MAVVNFERPSSSSQPSAGDSNIGSTSSEGGEVAKNVAMAYADIILQNVPKAPVDLAITNNFSFDRQSDITIDSGGGGRPEDVARVADVLTGNSKYITKSSLNDIIFLVMLVLIKSTAEQRDSRRESMVTKKEITRSASLQVYDLKMKEADEIYKAERKQAIMQIIGGAISIATGVISVVAGGLQLGQAVQSINGAVSSGLRTATSIMKAISSMASIASAGFGIARGVVGLDIAENRKKAAFLRADAERLQMFFESNMRRIKDMQEAYGESKRNIGSVMDTIKEVLERTRETKLGIVRNI